MKTGVRTKDFIIENNSTCWKHEKYEVIDDCSPCTAFEIKSKSKGVCIFTHNKEILRCTESGEIVIRSCDRVAWLDEKKFWTFQFSLSLIGTLSAGVSFLRQKSLNRKTMQKIQNQMC